MLLKVLTPLCLMLIIMFCKKLPYIGGKTSYALAFAGMSALLLDGQFSLLQWGSAWFAGLDRIAWIIGLGVFGSIYAQTQRQIGAIETVLYILRARFGRSPRGLITAIMATLALSSALLGDAYAAATIVGVLTIGAMDDLGLSGELITGIIAIGAAIGSIQAVFLSSSLLGIEPGWAMQPALLTITLGFVVCSFVVTRLFLNKDAHMPEELLMEEKAFQIFKEKWKTMIPLFLLIVCVICCVVIGGRMDFITNGLNLIKPGGTSLLTHISSVPLLKIFANKILLCILLATAVAFLYKEMRGKIRTSIVGGVKAVKSSLITQLCLALMLGGFYQGGTIDAIQKLTENLSANTLIFGGGAAILIIGMLTGTQSAPQSAVFTFLGPMLVSMGFHPVNVAIFGSHVAAAGQASLPANLLVIIASGIVGSQTGKEVKPMKAMLYSSICGLWLLLAGFLMIYLPAWPISY